jgi:hypothetical protein
MYYGVLGPRDFPQKHVEYKNYPFIGEFLQRFKISKIISGGAHGVETLAERYAKDHGISFTLIPPDIKAAGFDHYIAFKTRNLKIIEQSMAIVLFVDGRRSNLLDLIPVIVEERKAVHVCPLV